MTYSGRIRLVALVLVLLWSGLVLKLGMIQLIKGKHLEDWAMRELQCKAVLEPERGDIYDRMHRLLAGSIEVKSIGAFCPAIENKRQAAKTLSDMGLGDYSQVFAALRKGSRFVWIKRAVPDEIALKVKKANMPGIVISDDTKRYYPMGSLAGNLLGFVGEDKVGLEGIEYEYDSEVSGAAGWAVLQRVSGEKYPLPDSPGKKPERGKDLVLTIDASVQSVCEEELKATVEEVGGKHGVAIVFQPRTGEILAMANYPSYDPNLMGKGEPGTWKNMAVTDMFEPGSTFKIVADGAALDKSLVSLDEVVDTGQGKIQIGSRKIVDVEKHGTLTFAEAVAYSSNVAAVKIARRAGKKAVYETARGFGFGNPTGIRLPGEARGYLAPPRAWSEIRFANVAIGQGVAVTALQLALAFGAIANDGKLVEPVIVKSIVDGDGSNTVDSHGQVVRRVISEDAASKLRNLLVGVVDFGTGSQAALQGIDVAGKTGTAQKLDDQGRYVHDKVVCSFAGFLPAYDPKLVIVVVVDEPTSRKWGSDVAAPLFKKIAKKIIEMRPYQSEIYSSLAQAR
jgi:cell division protein FtsI (penicillin-binding protein 3)